MKLQKEVHGHRTAVRAHFAYREAIRLEGIGHRADLVGEGLNERPGNVGAHVTFDVDDQQARVALVGLDRDDAANLGQDGHGLIKRRGDRDLDLHRAGTKLIGELVHGTVGDELAGHEDAHPVADPLDLCQEVGRQEPPDAPRVDEAGDERQDLRDAGRVDGGGRRNEDHDLRRLDEGIGQAQALAHASRVLLDGPVRQLRGLRPLRTATVAHALLRAVAGQLITARRARQIERVVIRAATRELGGLPAALRAARLSPTEALRTAAYPPSAFRPVLDSWLFTLEADAGADPALTHAGADTSQDAVSRLLEQRLAAVSNQTPAFAQALRGYRAAARSGDQVTADGLAAWLGGQPNVASAAKRSAGIRGELDHFGAMGFLQGLLAVLRDSGHPGLLLVLDEVETLQRVRSDARDKAFNALRQLIDEIDSGRYPGMYLVITGTPPFYDGPSGIWPSGEPAPIASPT